MIKRKNMNKKNALEQFDEIVEPCKQTARNKAGDYGSSFTWYRQRSWIDKLFIKAKRIRTLQETGENRVGESIEGEFQAILNYGVLFLLQSERGFSPEPVSAETIFDSYEKNLERCRSLMKKKNHDYGEAWRDMSLIGIDDEIIVKLVRCRELSDQNKNSDDNILDIVNYAIFALILIKENKT